jgi:hypothetical protein
MKDILIENYGESSELLFADGLDQAIIGICPISYRVVYSRSKVIDCLMLEDLSYDYAIEHAEFNIFNSYVGELTPIWIDDLL